MELQNASAGASSAATSPVGSSSSSVAATVHCGWGRLIFGQTCSTSSALANLLREEQRGERDIAMYVRDPHVLLAQAPEALFLDPSHTFRKRLAPAPRESPCMPGYRVRPLESLRDAEQVAGIYARRGMVPVAASFLVASQAADGALLHLLAEDVASGEIIGTVTGVDHVRAFADPEHGCSLWALAVDPQSPHAGIGQALVCEVLAHYARAGRAYLDLSVLHDNQQAIRLYEKLGFERVPVFCVKRRNSVNAPLYVAHPDDQRLSSGALEIVREARRRGIGVDLIDAECAYFSLTHGGRTIVCNESLSELVSSVAASRCQDRRVVQRVLASAGLRVRDAGPACGEDVRIVVIDYEVVAAAVRRAPCVVGDGGHTLRALIEKQSRRRAAATRGEGKIPLDEETERCAARSGHALGDVLAPGAAVVVRETTDVRQGATMHDVTAVLHPSVVRVAKRAAETLDLPLVGLDLALPSLNGDDYAIVAADARPDLTVHEPQRAVARYLDLLFPRTITAHDAPAPACDEVPRGTLLHVKRSSPAVAVPVRHAG